MPAAQRALLAIVVAGTTLSATTSDETVALIRYLSNGTLDSEFSTDGKVSVDSLFPISHAALALGAFGKPVLVGRMSVP